MPLKFCPFCCSWVMGDVSVVFVPSGVVVHAPWLTVESHNVSVL
jgi:hypothetical protein